MKLIYTTLLAIALLHLLGCSEQNTPDPVVNISLENKSPRALDWVRLEWEGPDVPGGVLSVGVSKTSVGVDWPNLESATITFVDEESRTRYTIAVTLAQVNQQVRKGECQHITFRILDYDKAEVTCK